VQLNAGQVQDLLVVLTHLRSQMTPAVPMDTPLEKPLRAQIDPRYYTELDPITDGSALLLRDEGLGWTAFLLPPNEVEHLRNLFTKHIEARKTNPAPKPN
jgi:hypothetical protein